MGNCLFGGMGDPRDAESSTVVKVITSNGGILELYTPITAGCIANEFPGHAVFPSHDLFWRPLSLDDDLLAGHSYYLLPISTTADATPKAAEGGGTHHLLQQQQQLLVREGHVRSKSIPNSKATPYRMSLDYHGVLKRSYTDVLSRATKYSNTTSKCNNGIQCNSGSRKIGKGYYWKVKLVISPEQLVEILSQEDSTEELIESVRAVAKCGGGSGGSGVSSSSAESSASAAGFSDQWSRSSSRNASSKKDGLLIDL